KNYSEDEIRSWINRAYDQMIEDNSEDIDIDSPLLPEFINESNERTDIELELERIIFIEKGENYNPALFAADYLSE
ncbi:9456_t:CDS:2, partial [Diversispora eburnea]